MLPWFEFDNPQSSQENKALPQHFFTTQLDEETIDSSLNSFEYSSCPNDQPRRIFDIQTIHSPFLEDLEIYYEPLFPSFCSGGDSVAKPLHFPRKIRQNLLDSSEKTTCEATSSLCDNHHLLNKSSYKPEKGVFSKNSDFEPEFPFAENIRKLTGYRTMEIPTADTGASAGERLIESKAEHSQERPNIIFNEKQEASNCVDNGWKYWYGRVIGDEQEIKGGLEVLGRKPHNRQELRGAIRKWHDIQADKFVKEAKTSYY